MSTAITMAQTPSITKDTPVVQLHAKSHFPIKLISTNFLIWQRQVRSTLIGLDLLGYLDGTMAAPPQLVNNAPNPCYSIWFRQDQAIVGALLGSCADVVQPLISTAETAHAAWQNLHSSFASTSRGRIVFLKSKLGKNPRGNRSITDYLHDMRTIADELALVQSPISEEDLVVHVLNQVGPDYDPISSAALLRPSAISFTELGDILKNHEAKLQSSNDADTVMMATANLTLQHGGSGRSSQGQRDAHSGQSTNNNNKRGRGQSLSNYSTGNHRSSARQSNSCQFCAIPGHDVKDCRKLARFLRTHGIGQTHAINATMITSRPSGSYTGMFPFALPGAGTMPLQAPMAVTPFQTPVPQPSPFQPQLVSTMAPVNLTGALNAAGPSRPPQGTNPLITPDGHCVSVESGDDEWDIPRAHKKKKGKTIRPATSRNSTFERLGDREEGQRKSAKLRLGQSVAHVSAFARLGEMREAEPARTQRSRSNWQEPARTRASRQEEEAESQPRVPVANRLTTPNDRVQQMEAKLERLEKKVGEKNDRDKPLAGSPFTTRVHLTPFPRKVKIDAPRFTGKEDPEIHLDSFNQSATMNGCTDEEKCLLFFQTLRNRATEWFNKLRPGSIDSFSDLASKFKAKFQENCNKRKKFTYLSTAGQRESENLTQFLTRWKEEVDKVEEMDDKTVLSLLLSGLRAGELYKEFCWKPPATYQEAYHTAWEFAEAETQLRAKKEAEHGYKPKPVQVKKEEVPVPSRPRHHYDPVIRVVNTEGCQEMIDSGELGKDYLQKAQEKNHQWQWWEMAVDGASGPKGYGGGIVFTTPEGFKIYHAIIFNFKLTNNEAEYEALAGGLRLAQALKIDRVSIKSDSSLIVGQVTGNMEAREGRMAQYKDLILALLKGFKEFKIAQIPRAENADADLLSKLTQYAPEHVSKLARVEILDQASIEKLEVAAITGESQSDRSNLVGADDNWMYDLMEYLMDGTLPEQDDRARKVKLRAPRFQVLDGKLYKRAFGGPLLRGLTNREAERVIAEVHEGVCAAHQMSRTLSQRIILLGYYWPTIVQNFLRRREASRPGDGGKLAKNWEGPYRVRAIIRPGTYRLETLEGVPVERTWNSHHLRKFYK
ncbi:unnamed protein product [Cuscuta campestris]|uniref:RNase H type-1 domain-containing protein n=1 Tax=Cuscuta campestris TaxID=132261 RepID=A0A484MYU5_9ASTE|nr:unnamed protein product [Cuscuta campestris]